MVTGTRLGLAPAIGSASAVRLSTTIALRPASCASVTPAPVNWLAWRRAPPRVTVPRLSPK
ncbi:hypothetical protein D3C86_1180300 [compost metagenome]